MATATTSTTTTTSASSSLSSNSTTTATATNNNNNNNHNNNDMVTSTTGQVDPSVVPAVVVTAPTPAPAPAPAPASATTTATATATASSPSFRRISSFTATSHRPTSPNNGSSSSTTTTTTTGTSSISASDFQKIKLLGKGDVGKVYLVRKKDTGRLYAMKVLTKEEMVRRNKVKRAMTEREILATTDHPFIVTLYYSFQSVDRLYFVMEYCAGGEFFRLLQKQPGKCLSEEAAKFYAAEVLLALEYLHMMGFIYRDLKPENILVNENGHLRLTDFDLSRASATPTSPRVVKSILDDLSSLLGGGQKGPVLDTRQMTQFNSFVGTEEYIAPEVISGFGHTSSVDWWTFGILLYEMLFGKTPFKGQTQKETFEHIINCKNITFPREVSKNCKDIIKKLLNPDPHRRLGNKHGASEIRKHPWFKDINFALIRNQTPPIVPKITHELDTSNFRYIEDDTEDEDPPLLSPTPPTTTSSSSGNNNNNAAPTAATAATTAPAAQPSQNSTTTTTNNNGTTQVIPPNDPRYNQFRLFTEIETVKKDQYGLG